MSATDATRSQVAALVEQAARPIPLLWPLYSAVATNPLWDLRDLPFSAALGRARAVLGISGVPPAGLLAEAFRSGRITGGDLERALQERGEQPRPDPVEVRDGNLRAALGTILQHKDHTAGGSWTRMVDTEVARYCAAYVAGRLPVGPDGPRFFASWKSAVAKDPVGRRLQVDRLADEAGPTPEAAILATLHRIGVDEAGAVQELTGQLARLPGWAAHAKWRSAWAAPDQPGPALHLVDYLAVRLVYDLAALALVGDPRETDDSTADGGRGPATAVSAPGASLIGDQMGLRLARLEPEDRALVWLEAYEAHYRDQLLTALQRAGGSDPETPPSAQVICCIDVRAEGLRRHLEALGGYETFGFAGFFGVPARVWDLTGDAPLDLFPVLLQPKVEVTERAVDEPTAADALAARRQTGEALHAVDATRKGMVSAYALAEAGGLGLAPMAMARTVAPRLFARARAQLRQRVEPPLEAYPDLDGPGAPTDEEQSLYAESALRAMGLTSGFAPLVVLCGHGSTTENNPYASALDCGACGAARGGRSARLAAAILNRPAVRARLDGRGIHIPRATLFVAAEHDTTTDDVTLFPPDRLDPRTEARLASLAADLVEAGAALAAERIATLPGAANRIRRDPMHHVALRSTDWAQVQPEWGLARCAAFIVGPRRLTAGCDLQRRAFLHSYDPQSDPDGTALEAVLSGPMVVAQWIASAYYHSTTDPDILGAGDKVAHNVVAGVGVYQGAGGDLKLGLPRQAVFDGSRPYHEPMRLLVVIAAPRERIDVVIGRQPVIRELVEGSWVNLTALDRGSFWLRRAGGGWRPWSGAGDSDGPVIDNGSPPDGRRRG